MNTYNILLIILLQLIVSKSTAQNQLIVKKETYSSELVKANNATVSHKGEGSLQKEMKLDKQTSAQTKIIAHRGFSGIAPENTLIAFQKAIESNADYLELDVHKTKDDSLVVIHDSSVDKTSSNGSKGEISEMNYSDLNTVRVGYSEKFGDKYQNEKIPTLREVLQLAKGKIKVCIEIKAFGIEDKVLKMVNDLEVNDEVIIFCFHYRVLVKIRQLDKNIPILYLTWSVDNTTIDYAKLIDVDAIGVGKTVSKEYLELAHKNGIEVWKWTVNKEDEMKQLIELGLDGIITDFPDKALKNKCNVYINRGRD